MVKPKKHLGQHFLTDKKTAEKIVNRLYNENKYNVIEIGPGKGALTEFLLKKDYMVYFIDPDVESLSFLEEKYPGISEKLINEDFIKTDMNIYKNDKLCLISNLPYNISAPVMFKVFNNRDIISESVFMLQREVARRICSEHGSKVYGILSVLIQTYFDTKYLFTVKEGAFFPKPAVKSGVIHIKRNPEKIVPDNPELHEKIVKTAFNKRRKTLRNSLKSILLPLQTDQEWLQKRPEQCSVEDFVNISNYLNSKNRINGSKSDTGTDR